jgi:hypothetical protein
MKWSGIGTTGYFYQDDDKYSISPSDENSGFIGDLVIGTRTYYYNEFYFDGRVDEIRVSDIVRSDAWISTSYNTMNNPSSFLTIGPEEPKNRAYINSPFLLFLQNNPYLFPILRHLLRL